MTDLEKLRKQAHMCYTWDNDLDVIRDMIVGLYGCVNRHTIDLYLDDSEKEAKRNWGGEIVSMMRPFRAEIAQFLRDHL